MIHWITTNGNELPKLHDVVVGQRTYFAAIYNISKFVVVDDENDEIRTVKQRTIKRVRLSQANVEDVLTTRAG